MIGLKVLIVKCPKDPQIVRKTGRIVEQKSKIMWVVEFPGGYRQVIRENWMIGLPG